MRAPEGPRSCPLVGGSAGVPPRGPAVSASPTAFIHTATYTAALPQHGSNRHRHGSHGARGRVRPRTERGATHRTLLVPVGMETLGMRRFPLETRRASAVKGVDEYSQTTSFVGDHSEAAWEPAAAKKGSSGGSSSSSSSARDAQQQQQQQRSILQHNQQQQPHQQPQQQPQQQQHRHQPQHVQGAGEGRNGGGRGGGDSDPAGEVTSGTPPAWSRDGLERAGGGGAEGKAVGDGVVVARQKAFVKRMVNLGMRRRGREVLDLMHRVQIEGSPPFNLFMYNACITALARCGRWRQALSVLDGMRQAAAAADAANETPANETAAKEPSGPIADVGSRSSAIGMAGTGPSGSITDAGSGSAANDMAGTGPSRPTTDAVPGLGKPVVRPDVVSYSAAITACGNAGQRRRALTLLSDMRAEGVSPNVVSYNAAAHACVGDGAAGNHVGAEQRGEGCSLVLGLMAEMRADCVSPDVFTFSTAITACGRAGQWERALSLLEEMEANPDNFQAGRDNNQQQQKVQDKKLKRNLTPDVVAINAAIAACGRAGQWKRSLDLLDRMTTRHGTRVGLTAPHLSDERLPNPDAEDATAEASTANVSSVAASLAGTLNAAASSVAASKAVVANAVSPRTISSSPALVEAHPGERESRGQDRDSDLSSRSVPPPLPTAGAGRSSGGAAWPLADAVSFNSAMEACAKAGQWEEGVALLLRMLQAGVRPDIKSFAASLACLRAGGQWERAVELLEEMEAGKHGLSPDLGCYGAVMATLGEAGQWERALDLLRLLQRRGAEAGAAAWAVEQSSEAGWDSERLAAEATGHAAKTSSPNAGPNLVCYNAAMAACARAGEWAPALDLLKEMEERGIFDTVSFNCAMHACRGQGQWRKATSILGRMVSGDTVRGAAGGAERMLPPPDAYSFTSAITACGAVGQADRAVELLRDMKAAGVAPTVVVFNAVIAAVARSVNRSAVSGDVSSRNVDPIEGDNAESSGEDNVESIGEGEGPGGGSYAGHESGPEGAAVATAEEAEQVSDSTARVDAASEGRASCKRAQELLVEMRETGLVPGLKSYNTVLAVCQRAGEWEGALEVLAEMKRGKVKQRRDPSQGRDASQSVAAVASGSDPPVPPPDLISFNTAMGACGRARRWQEALRLLEELRGFGFCPDMVSYNTAAAACARVEKWDLALEVINRGREAGVLPSAVNPEGSSYVFPPQERGGDGGGVGDGVVEDVAGGRVAGGGRGGQGVDASGFYFTVEEMVRREERTSWLRGGNGASSS